MKESKKINSKENKKSNNKEKRLLDEGFKLFLEKGIKSTSIQDIVDKANVAKGTFYLYFRDKYELRDILIMKKSQKLFRDALKNLEKAQITNFSDQIIFIVDYVIDILTKNPILLQFISKDLGWGIFNKVVMKVYSKYDGVETGIVSLFLRKVKENHLKLEKPEVTLFMIVELVSSTCFTCILYEEPLSIEEYKPILHKEIKRMLAGK